MPFAEAGKLAELLGSFDVRLSRRQSAQLAGLEALERGIDCATHVPVSSVLINTPVCETSLIEHSELESPIL
jgi:hypothetical protein